MPSKDCLRRVDPVEPQIAKSPLKTKYGLFELYVFSWSPNEQDNVLALISEKKQESPLVRVQSACYTGEIFESLDCDCHWQLETALQRIHDEGGILIYMLCDGRGAGLLTKIRGMEMTATMGLDTAEAYVSLGSPVDPREYERAGYVLKYFDVGTCRLLTNNPRKVEGLRAEGIFVEREAHESQSTEDNKFYLKSKAQKLGHIMKEFDVNN